MNEALASTRARTSPQPPAAGEALAVVLHAPRTLAVERLALEPPGPADVVVAVRWSGISAGTERLLWSGEMPAFPGMGYPLVPGYESVGRVLEAGAESGQQPGALVFVPGARCFGPVRGLFGGAAARLVVAGERVRSLPEGLDERAVLLALAATAWHATEEGLPELIIGHGALGRLLARVTRLRGGPPPVVWERDARRQAGAEGYTVLAPEQDPRRDYGRICDASGDPGLLDTLIARLAPRGELVLAGFYATRPSFDFAPAFLREARLRVAAEWAPTDLDAVLGRVAAGALSLEGLITHRSPARAAEAAYRTAFEDAGCLKMILDWGDCS